MSQSRHELHFTKFRKSDFPDYKSWYEDAELHLHLGPMDDEWLQSVMNETDGAQYSFFRDQELVAVVGIKFPDEKHAAYFITDFAIKPTLRGQGVGSEVLDILVKSHALKPGQTWRAFIDVKNPRAKDFFEKNDWVCNSPEPDEHGMLMLEFKK